MNTSLNIINSIKCSTAAILSYSYMPNMKSVIQKHNSKILEDPKPTNNKTCNSRQKSDCPLNQNCLSEC